MRRVAHLLVAALLLVACGQVPATQPPVPVSSMPRLPNSPAPSAIPGEASSVTPTLAPTPTPSPLGGSPVPRDAVVAIDPLAWSIAGVVPVGGDPLLLDIAGGQVWTMDFADGTLSRVDPASMTRSIVDLPGDAVALHAAGDKLWAAAAGHDLVRLDGATGTVEKTVHLAEERLFALRDAGFFTIDGDAAWMTVPVVGTNKPQTLWHIDLATGAMIEPHPIGRGPLTPLVAEGAVWVPVPAEAGLTRLDLATGALAHVSLRDQPLWVAAGAGSIWVAAERSHEVRRLSPTGETVAAIHVDSTPRGVAFGGGSIWVATEGGLSEIDPEINALVRELRLVKVSSGSGGTSVAFLDGLVWVSIE